MLKQDLQGHKNIQIEQSKALQKHSGDNALLPQKIKQLSEDLRVYKEKNYQQQQLIREIEKRDKTQHEYQSGLEQQIRDLKNEVYNLRAEKNKNLKSI